MVSKEMLKLGLTSDQAAERLSKNGKNMLPEKPPPSDLSIFLAQIKSPLVYILLFAATLTFLLGEFSDTTIILFAVFLNTILGFLQERKANHSLEALKKMLHPTARVIRDGNQFEIEAELLVPEDIVVIFQGDKVPGDGIVVESNRFFIDEAMLTGESVPVAKNEEDIVYMGTVAVGGNAIVRIKQTGAHTEMGKIAASVSGPDEDTPLRRQLAKFSRFLTYLVIFLVLTILAIGIIKDVELVHILTTAVALAVSAIPEGLLVGLTVVLAIGMQRILKRKGLVRNLVSAETLGGVTTICADKTGTLTQGKMQVTDIIGDDKEIEIQTLVANDLDDPIVVSAYEWSKQRVDDHESVINQVMRLDSIPFSSEQRFFACLNKYDEENNTIYINGAPEILLERSTVSENEKKDIRIKIDELSIRGKRLIGFAQKKVSSAKTSLQIEDLDSDLKWIGFLAFDDPIRPDVKEALERTKQAGIKLIVITGDYANTASSILRMLGFEIKLENIILGEELYDIDDNELSKRLKIKCDVKLFARTKPEQKLRIVQILKDQGEVVAMMGDGVNDAPALARADIGIVVGDATEVAKESADLVLLDSSFSTIVAAVEEGRGIFDNIRKIILYLLSDGFLEILAVMLALIFNLPIPISAAQLLWINLVSDGFPHLALTVDPKNKNIMNRPPRPTDEKLISGWMRVLMVIISTVGGIFAFTLFYLSYRSTGDPAFARSVTFATVGVTTLVYVFSVRTLREPFWKENILGNKWLVVAVFAGMILQFLPYINSTVGNFLEIVPIGGWWFAAVGSSVAVFILIEVMKEIFNYIDIHNRKARE